MLDSFCFEKDSRAKTHRPRAAKCALSQALVKNAETIARFPAYMSMIERPRIKLYVFSDSGVLNIHRFLRETLAGDDLTALLTPCGVYMF